MAMRITPARTIDDFLEQLYREHTRLLPDAAPADAAPPDACRRRPISSSCRPRRYGIPLPLLSLCVANSSDAAEILMLSYLLADARFRRDMSVDAAAPDDDAATSSLEGADYLAGSVFFGMLLGGTLLGLLSDHVGRRPALLAGLAMNAVFGLLSAVPVLSPTMRYLTAWRFLAGIGIGATVPSLFSLASEWSPKQVRGTAVTLVASFWMVGSLFVSGLAWVIFRSGGDFSLGLRALPTWRMFAALCATPSAVGALMVYFHVPESPRFLASAKHNYGQAARVCNQLAESLGLELRGGEEGSVANSGDAGQSRMEDDLLEEGNETNEGRGQGSVRMTAIKRFTEYELRQDYAATPSSNNVGLCSVSSVRPSRTLRTLLVTLQKLYSPRLFTRTTLPLQIIWFSISFGTYGITTWINTLFTTVHLEDIYFNTFLFALANLPGNIVSVKYADRWGRKKMLVGSLVGAAAALSVFALVASRGEGEGGNDVDDGVSAKTTSKTQTRGIVLSACFFQMCSIISWNAIDVLTGELFPTRVRSAGMGACTAAGRCGAMAAQFVNARLILTTGEGTGVAASASVLGAAAAALLVGAIGPSFLERDMALGGLRDEVTEEPAGGSVALGCMAKLQGRKDHSSDDETERDFGLRHRGLNEYQSIQEGESFLL